ncbi:MAG: hypothetical protein OS130_05210 [Thermodesulfobacteriota bacterium]|jgi:hypothetical protein|nr:MAG: hypothetical protein OS130_05210 [Thermodesulfobacteriota bacterium]
MVIKDFLRFLLLLICCFCVVSSVAFAEDGSKKPNCAFTWTFYSNYIWQGLELSKANPFSPPSNSKEYNQGLSFTPWQSFDTRYRSSIPWDNKGKNHGVIAYQDSFSLTNETALNWKLGWLTYDTDAEENEKVFAGIGLNTFLSPGVSFWKGREFKQDAWTINFALSQNWDLSKCLSRADGWSLGLSSGVSYSNFDNVDYNDLQNANVWAGLNIPFKDGISLTPSINYSFPMKDLKRDMYEKESFRDLESGFVFGGVDLKIPF